ncbi:MAG TPA: DUF2254 domain-containing protein [Ignavibacteriaceae bacterium]|nr:DUF2254 domain-containing protein [Ignavibacteriaceae bacterium]
MGPYMDVFHSKFRDLWINLKSSLWFFPSIIIFLFSLTAFISILIDVVFNRELNDMKLAIFGSSAEGARGILATIAASMITVAGVVFSITIVALSLTSSQYSSRVLRNFMKDHNNQFVLGVFIGIFAFCLIVLGTVRGQEDLKFVPKISVLLAVILSFLGIGVFIFFIHHIASSIQASQIISNIYNETMDIINEVFPDALNAEQEEENERNKIKWMEDDNFYTVVADKSGYIQKIDKNLLLKSAKHYDIVLRVEVPVGTCLIESTPYISIQGKKKPDDEVIKSLRNALTIDKQRTIEQDPAYGIRQLVDVALKALSPGINDTTTAIMCIERLTAILCRITERKINNCIIRDEGTIKVIIEELDFTDYMDEAFNQIRDYGTNNIVVLRKLSWAFKNIKFFVSTPHGRDSIKKHTDALSAVLNKLAVE